MKRKAASTMPTPTAMVRSTKTVSRKVVINTTMSLKGPVRMNLKECHSDM